MPTVMQDTSIQSESMTESVDFEKRFICDFIFLPPISKDKGAVLQIIAKSDRFVMNTAIIFTVTRRC